MGGKICPKMEFNPVHLKFDMGKVLLIRASKQSTNF